MLLKLRRHFVLLLALFPLIPLFNAIFFDQRIARARHRRIFLITWSLLSQRQAHPLPILNSSGSSASIFSSSQYSEGHFWAHMSG